MTHNQDFSNSHNWNTSGSKNNLLIRTFWKQKIFCWKTSLKIGKNTRKPNFTKKHSVVFVLLWHCKLLKSSYSRRQWKEQNQPPEVFNEKNVSLKVLQNSQKYTSARVPFLIKLQAWDLQLYYKNTLCRLLLVNFPKFVILFRMRHGAKRFP